jgi:hypothetical protein
MKNVILSLAVTTALAVAAGSYAADESADTKSNLEYKENGGYKASVTTEKTTPEGTAISSKTKKNVDVDADGKTTSTMRSSSVEDPTGLRNKKIHTGELDYRDKDNGGYKKSVTSTDTDAAGSNTSTSQKTNVDVDAAGNKTITEESTRVIDPPGLMNKTQTVTKSKTVNGVVVEDNTKTN